MCEDLRLERQDDSPWGFRLTGGLDFGTPLSIIKVTGGTIAELSGIQVGDLVKKINGQSTRNFTHVDAQNCIAFSGNNLTLSVMRGSLVTPPATPLRGTTPTPMQEMNGFRPISEQRLLSPHDLKDRLEIIENNYSLDPDEGLHSPLVIQQKFGERADISYDKSEFRVNDDGQLLYGDKILSDVEIAELLTGNEEVLDQGIFGINFQKFLPQVDFIRKSEVFKLLQNENVRKEESEEVQLRKEPTKRFSTFLMKPAPPPKKLSGPTFIHPKAPRYLPRQLEPKWEVPKLRQWERPKKEDPGHTVLWLFLEEKGEQVVDERWGTVEEERENMSRNESRETDRCSVGSSMQQSQNGRESQLSSMCEDSISGGKTESGEEGGGRVDVEQLLASGGGQREEAEWSEEHRATLQQEEQTSCRIAEEEMIQEECIIKEKNKSTEKHTVSSHLIEQLNEIQSQIEALEVEAPLELQSQLLAVKDHLSKIVQIKAQLQTNKQITEYNEEFEETTEEKSTEIEKEELLEIKSATEDTILTNEEYIEQTEEVEEVCEVEEIVQHVEMKAEMEMSYEYEVCEAAPQKKRTALPLTPQLRPIVLPGGRMWRQPKDAAHEELYQGILVSQAEVLVGSTVGINFTKYIPPKFDMSHSAVYRLIHEIEDRSPKGAAQREKAIAESDYHNPISKRHFYLASLPEPRPIGAVELSELKCF